MNKANGISDHEVMQYEKYKRLRPMSHGKGLCKLKQIPKNPINYGSGWVGPGLTRTFFVWKIVPKIALNQY